MSDLMVLKKEFERVYDKKTAVEAGGRASAWVHVEGSRYWYLYDIGKAIAVLSNYENSYVKDDKTDMDVTLDLENESAYLWKNRDFNPKRGEA